MKNLEKYSDISRVLPKLPEVLLNTIQSDILEIKSIDRSCDKYMQACLEFDDLKNAYYVVFSKYIDKANHPYEKFIFLAENGEELFDISGAKMELYGILTCANLHYTKEYENN